MKLARHYQALLDSGKFENRAGLARYLGVSRARVTQVLRRLAPLHEAHPVGKPLRFSPISGA